nr:MAG: hypothetical protein DIU57_17880 [Pseudomonadota bacterium]
MRWYLSFGGDTAGPLSVSEIAEQSSAGRVPVGTFMRPENSEHWQPFDMQKLAASESAELTSVVQAAEAQYGWQHVVLAVAAAFFVIMALVLISDYLKPAANKVTPTPSAERKVTAAAPPKPESRQPTFKDQLLAARNLREVLPLLTPLFGDTFERVDPAAAVFAVWGSDGRLTWSDIQAAPATKHSLVMKDPEANRGKRLCVSGEIVQIEADRSAVHMMHSGVMGTESWDFVRFVALGSSGDLVQDSWARFCGIVTGKQSYNNTQGGVTHAVFAVGMFDLPENRNRKVTP